jgi:hypothetical protein
LAKKENSKVTDAKDKLKMAMEAWGPIYDKAREDLYFLSDEPDAQWDEKDYAARTKKHRPTLTVDQLGQFVNQVSNDIRMNTPSINVSPKGSGADVETAEIFKGLIRDIELQTNADIAYDTAASFAIESSIGFFRIDHGYSDAEGWEQELKFQRVVNPHLLFLDANSIMPDGSDAMCGFALELVSEDEWEKRWPGKEFVGFECETLPAPDKKAKEAYALEYFYIEEQVKTRYLLADGQQGEVDGELDPKTLGDVKASRPITKRKVHRCFLSGKEELDATTFPGIYIPIIPVYGKESWREGKRHLHSLIRKSKDAQRSFNYWVSTEVELLMKAPKAPVIAAENSTEPYAKDWINPDKASVLRYVPYDDEGRPIPAPQIGNAPQIPAGIVNARRESAEDIKTTMGLYNASLGQRSNEVSGKAITARKMEGDAAVYHFGDNLVRSVTHGGRILVHAIPEIYDTPRVVSVVGHENTSDLVGINGEVVEGQERSFMLAQGQYDVRVTTSAPFATLRQEAAEFFQQIVMTSPEMMGVVGDLMFKYMDFPGAQAVSERLKRTIPPAILGDEKENPQMAAMAQQQQALEATIVQLQQQATGLQEQLANKREEIALKAQTELAKDATERQKQQVELARLQLDEIKIDNDFKVATAELALKQEELQLQAQENQIRLAELAKPAETPQSSDVSTEGS